MQRTINFTISDKNTGQRLDQALAQLLPELSRSRIQQWIKSGELTLNDLPTSPKQKVYQGDRIDGNIAEPPPQRNKAQHIKLSIIFEDNELIIINKPAGLVVHPGAGNPDQTLLNALLYHCNDLQEIPRAGIVHRLDKDTSGLMVVAKTLEAQFDLVKQLQARTVKRHYQALVSGELISAGTVNAAIGRSSKDRLRMAVVPQGKEAITHYRILKRYQGFSLIECQLETGRTHQIRVHLTHLRHPLVGDPLYGGRARLPKGLDTSTREIILAFPRQALHAKKLAFLHPTTQKNLLFESDLPEDFETLLASLPKSSPQ